MKNAAILFSDFGPYHVARINALARELLSGGITLTAYRFTERSNTYGWLPVEPQGVEVVTLAPEPPLGAIPSLKLAIAFAKSLKHRKVGTVFLPSYSPLPNTLCLLATKWIGAKAVMMNESWRGTEKAGGFGRFAKKCIVKWFDAALVGGSPQVQYAADYGIPASCIFTGYDVVDVDHFARMASAADDGNMPWLPKRFFLNLGRFVEKKNLPLLVKAYAAAVSKCDDKSIALVFVGEGPSQTEIEKTAEEAGLSVVHPMRDGRTIDGPGVMFYPFQQTDLTPRFFARAEAFILPSSYEEWGLVVNEAMACATPVIVSNKVGSSFDLVQVGRNGYTFDPTSQEELSTILGYFLSDPSLRDKMGREGQTIIQDWKPERFGKEGFLAMQAAHGFKGTID